MCQQSMFHIPYHIVNAPSQWEMTLHCNIVSHWLGAYTKLSLTMNYDNTVEPLWKGQESLTEVAKFGQFPCTILYKSCLLYPSWQATSFERPPFWVAFIEGFHCITTTKQSTIKTCAYFMGYTCDRDSWTRKTKIFNPWENVNYRNFLYHSKISFSIHNKIFFILVVGYCWLTIFGTSLMEKF